MTKPNKPATACRVISVPDTSEIENNFIELVNTGRYELAAKIQTQYNFGQSVFEKIDADSICADLDKAFETKDRAVIEAIRAIYKQFFAVEKKTSKKPKAKPKAKPKKSRKKSKKKAKNNPKNKQAAKQELSDGLKEFINSPDVFVQNDEAFRIELGNNKSGQKTVKILEVRSLYQKKPVLVAGSVYILGVNTPKQFDLEGAATSLKGHLHDENLQHNEVSEAA